MLVDVLAGDDDDEYVVAMRPHKRRPGRPKILPDNTRIELQVPNDLLDAFTKLVGPGNRPQVIRDLMQRYVDDCQPQR